MALPEGKQHHHGNCTQEIKSDNNTEAVYMFTHKTQLQNGHLIILQRIYNQSD